MGNNADESLNIASDGKNITFSVPSAVSTSCGKPISIVDGEYTYNSSLYICDSYLNSFTPSFKTYGFDDNTITISGNATVVFADGTERPDVKKALQM